jgi:hypothetical protein
MKRQFSTVVCRLMKKASTMSSRARSGGRGACPERSEGICFCLFSIVGRRLAVAAILCGLVGIVPYLAVTQEQSDVEAESQQTPLIGVTSSTDNPLQLALLHWYNANLTTTFGVGGASYGVAFDGANIWVANGGDSTVTKLRASDGKVLGTFAVGSFPYGVAFDGANIWVTNAYSNNVTKLRATVPSSEPSVSV